MFPRTLYAVLASTALLLRPLSAVEANVDIPPLDAKTLAQQIESYTAAQAQQKKAFFENTRTQLQKTLQQSGSAGNYVLGCMKQVRFGDVKGGGNEGATWKKDNAKLYSDHDVELAASLHLRYLALTLKRAEWDSAEPVQQETWDYLALLNKSADLLATVKKNPQQVKFSVYDAKQGKVVDEMVGSMQATGARLPDNPRSYVDQLLNNPVTSGWVAATLGLEGHLDGLKSWETSPGAFSGILEKDIRPYLREKKDPKLISTWDYEISFLNTVAAKSDGKALEKFDQEERPRLLWKQAADIELLGMPNKALQLRLNVAKNYPHHPDFERWTSEIMEKLEALKKSAAESEKAEGKETPSIPEGASN